MKQLLIVLSIFLFSISCGNDPEPEVKFDSEFLDYTFFQEGSYWIYEDSISKSTDSIYSIYLEFRNVEKLTPTREIARLQFKSSFLNDTIIGWGTSFYNEEVKPNIYLENLRNSTPYISFFAPAEIGDTISINEEKGTVFVKLIATFFQDDIIYNGVKVFHNLDLDTKVYFAKGIGLIRKEDGSGKIWKLKKFYLNK